MILGNVPSRAIHPNADYADDCMVRVIAMPVHGSARVVVECIFEQVTARVPREALTITAR